MAGFRKQTSFRTLDRREWTKLDGLCTTGLQAVFQYWDAQTDDAALTRAVMQAARSLGATLCCPAEFLGAETTATECITRFRLAQQIHETRSCVLVNAAGPWAAEVVQRISPRPPAPAVENVLGSHLELPGRV